MTTERCRNPDCGEPAATHPRRRGLCTACDAYRRKYHRTRPETAILAHYHRNITRM